MNPQHDEEIKPDTLAAWWFGAPAIGNVLSVVPWFRLLFLSPGMTYQAIGPFVFILFISFGTLVISLAVGAVMFRKRQIARGLFCVLSGLLPVVVGLGAGYLISSWRGVTIPVFRQYP